MTIRQIEMEMINSVIFDNCCMGELGNQRMVYGSYNGPAKMYFESKKIRHTSFDINNKDGSIKIDLSKPIPKKYFNKFDIVTNAGTSEHITNAQFEVFKNIHDLCKVGGYMIHSIPQKGCWGNHCPHKYTKYFIKKIAQANQYKILFDESILRRGKNYLICGILQKTKMNFVKDSIWLNEIIDCKKYKINTDNYK